MFGLFRLLTSTDRSSGEVPAAFVKLSVSFDDPKVKEACKTRVKEHIADNTVAYKHLHGGVFIVEFVPASVAGIKLTCSSALYHEVMHTMYIRWL